jgi:hypothetical protein
LRFIPARIPCILESEGSSKEYRENWARLIQKFKRLIPELSQVPWSEANQRFHRR